MFKETFFFTHLCRQRRGAAESSDKFDDRVSLLNYSTLPFEYSSTVDAEVGPRPLNAPGEIKRRRTRSETVLEAEANKICGTP